MSHFQTFEVVDRGSDTQLLMGENLNKILYWAKLNIVATFSAECISIDCISVTGS